MKRSAMGKKQEIRKGRLDVPKHYQMTTKWVKKLKLINVTRIWLKTTVE